MENNNQEILSIEKRLDSILKPVNPEENYMTSLKQRLKNESGITIDKPDYLLVILIVGSLFFFGLTIVLILNLVNHKKSS
jgi:hypothetical protein